MIHELHILSAADAVPASPANHAVRLLLPLAPSALVVNAQGEPTFSAPPPFSAPPGALLEALASGRKQLRLLARFPAKSLPRVNGAPAPHLAVMSPGDIFHWTPGHIFHVALFSRPQIGPPPAASFGRPCPVCRVPLVATTTCVACQCGVVLHCEPDGPGALRCAQMSRECPVCHRPIVLTEGYVNPSANED